METILDYGALFVVIWLIPHIPMLLGLDIDNSYWESYRASGVMLLILCGFTAFMLVILLSIFRIFGW